MAKIYIYTTFPKFVEDGENLGMIWFEDSSLTFGNALEKIKRIAKKWRASCIVNFKVATSVKSHGLINYVLSGDAIKL